MAEFMGETKFDNYHISLFSCWRPVVQLLITQIS